MNDYAFYTLLIGCTALVIFMMFLKIRSDKIIEKKEGIHQSEISGMVDGFRDIIFNSGYEPNPTFVNEEHYLFYYKKGYTYYKKKITQLYRALSILIYLFDSDFNEDSINYAKEHYDSKTGELLPDKYDVFVVK
jgi:hypothetical protein